MTLRTLNYGNYGTFLIMGNAGFCPSTVSLPSRMLYPNPEIQTETLRSLTLPAYFSPLSWAY